MKAKHLSKAQQFDRITTLPEGVLDTILCLIPIEEAARTSILSRQWRYKWTKIPKLRFLQCTINTEELPGWSRNLSVSEYHRRKKKMRCKLFYAIHQVLLLRRGPILEFTLSLDAQDTCFEIDQIILHLSMNHTVKKLGFYFYDMSKYDLPSSFFSLHHLTDLNLEYCDFKSKPLFKGFGSLTRLSLDSTRISKETFLHLLSNCPSLKRFCLVKFETSSSYVVVYPIIWTFKTYLNISKSMQILYEEHFLTDEKPSVMELFKCLPVIEHLTIWGYIIPSFVRASVPQELPVSLIHLKHVFIRQMCVVDGYGLPFLAILIKCSPNLEKIKLAIDDDYDQEIKPVMLKQYSKIRLEHLNELEIAFLSNYKPELDFVKFIIARSPNLKKVILVKPAVDKNEEMEMFKVLLSAQCGSPVRIVVKNCIEEFNDDD